MAKYDGTHACGHAGQIILFGKTSEREWQIKRFFWDDCEACKAEKRQLANEEARARQAEKGIPALTGSDKQIAWANTIRDKFIAELDQIIAKAADADAGKLATIKKVRAYVITNTKASWWIDRRGMTPNTYYRDNHAEITAAIEKMED